MSAVTRYERRQWQDGHLNNKKERMGNIIHDERKGE